MFKNASWEKSKVLAHLLVSFSSGVFPCLSIAANVEDIRVWVAPDHTRLVFDLNESVSYTAFTLDNPQRLVIDFANSKMLSSLSDLDFANSPVLGIRSGVRDGNNLRVVLDLASSLDYESFTLEANGDFRDRLVVDVIHNISLSSIVTARTVPIPQLTDKRDIRVAVVAGHGGEDPGAPGYDGKIWEKNVTLAVARAIRDRLERTPGYTPIMIRDGDYSVELKSRPVIARDHRVDIYLSIHADSYRSASAEGVTIYALSGDIADQENARRIAQKENRADLLGAMSGETRIADIDDDLALTLLDLSMAWSMDQSLSLGTHILSTVGSVAKLRRDKVQGGNLWELRSPDIPSILIETGYLSNPGEARKLVSGVYQDKLADAIVQGVMNYFNQNPPAETLIAWQKANGTTAPLSYKVVRGDSLSEIAQRFKVSLAEIKAANHLSNNTIRIGQTLTIPGKGEAMSLPIEYRILRGDTLSEIAERHNVSLGALRQLNSLSGDSIRVGQVLRIPTY